MNKKIKSNLSVIFVIIIVICVYEILIRPARQHFGLYIGLEPSLWVKVAISTLTLIPLAGNLYYLACGEVCKTPNERPRGAIIGEKDNLSRTIKMTCEKSLLIKIISIVICLLLLAALWL